MSGITDLLSAMQNGVQAINALVTKVGTVFPQSTASSTSVTAGTITFSSSLATGFLIVQTSSGATVKVPFYSQ